MISMPDIIVFLFFDLGFLWLYVLIFHKPDWICNRFGDIEKAVSIIMIDSISILIVVFFFQTSRLIRRLLNPILKNLVYPFGASSSYFSKRINNEIVYLSNLFEKSVVDPLIATLDNVFLYPILKVYMNFIKPKVLIMTSIFTPMFLWVERRKRQIETIVSFVRYLKEFHKKIWQW
jgi:hypothetical protein